MERARPRAQQLPYATLIAESLIARFFLSVFSAVGATSL